MCCATVRHSEAARHSSRLLQEVFLHELVSVLTQCKDHHLTSSLFVFFHTFLIPAQSTATYEHLWQAESLNLYVVFADDFERNNLAPSSTQLFRKSAN